MAIDIDLFLFDLAGTTVRDDGLVLAAFRTVVDGEGLRPDDDWLIARMGLDKRRVFRELLSSAGADLERVPQLVGAFDEAISARIRREGTPPLPGATESIAALRRAGAQSGFITGFSRRIADEVIDSSGLPFDVVVASDEVEHGRPAPDLIYEAMRQAGVGSAAGVGVAGDTPSDLQAGAAAGCGVIVGVGCGTHTLAQLEPHPHTWLLADLRDLPRRLGIAGPAA